MIVKVILKTMQNARKLVSIAEPMFAIGVADVWLIDLQE